jgi:transcriptional regulator with XRE-family HTH domain
MTKDPKIKIGDNIRELRQQKGWSQEYLGYFAQVNQDTMSRVESGKAGLSLLTLVKITAALDKPLNSIFQ